MNNKIFLQGETKIFWNIKYPPILQVQRLPQPPQHLRSPRLLTISGEPAGIRKQLIKMTCLFIFSQLFYETELRFWFVEYLLS